MRADAFLRHFAERYEWDALMRPRPALPVSQEKSGVTTPLVTGPYAFAPGCFVDRYVLVRELRQGGHGIVWLARDTAVDREVIVKIPRSDGLIASEAAIRFIVEMRATGRLSHPNIVPIYDVGVFANSCYLVMPYFSLGSLADCLAQGSREFTFRQIAQLASDLATAMQYAHQNQVLHRDLKPSNILLTTAATPSTQSHETDELVPLIADFGLAKLREGASVTELTLTGAVFGTPSYMAPEQAAGRTAEVGVWTDVYAIGATMFELLTGRPPFCASNPTEVLRQVIDDEPVAPRRLRSIVPRDLETITLKCLEKHPRHRYQSASALADDLSRFVEGSPIRARSASIPTRAVKWARRHPALAAYSVAGVLALVAIAMAAIWHMATLNRAMHAARAAEARAESQSVRLRNQVYQQDLQMAYQALQRGDTVEALELSAPYVSVAGSDQKGFFAHLLARSCIGSPRTFSGLKGDVYDIAYSADGGRVAAVDATGHVRVWNSQSGAALPWPNKIEGYIDSIVFSADGKYLASSGSDGGVQLSDATTGELVKCLGKKPTTKSPTTFSPDSSYLFCQGADNAIQVWNVASGRLASELVGHSAEINALAVSSDGELLASGSTDASVRLWNTADWSCRGVLQGHDGSVTGLCFSREGNTLASCGVDHTVRLWSINRSEQVVVLSGHRNRNSGVAFLHDDRRLASASADGTIRFWHLDQLPRCTSFHAQQGRIWQVVRSPAEDELATAGSDGTIRLWDAGDWTAGKSLFSQPVRDCTISVSPNNRTLAVANNKGVFLFDLAANRLDRQLSISPPSETSNQLKFLEDSRSLAYASHYHEFSDLCLWNTQRDSLIGHRSWWKHCEAKSDPTLRRVIDSGLSIVATQADVWDLTKAQEQRLNAAEQILRFVSTSRDGAWLATASDRTVFVGRAAQRSMRYVIESDRGNVEAIAISPNGEWLATADGQRHIDLRHLSTGQLASHRVQLLEEIGCLAFSPGEPFLCAGCGGGQIHILAVPSGRLLWTMAGHRGKVTQLEFSRDRTLLISVGGQERSEVFLWTTAGGSQLQPL